MLCSSNPSVPPARRADTSACLSEALKGDLCIVKVNVFHLCTHDCGTGLAERRRLAQLIADVGNLCGSEAVNS